jgi:hypothetical protein
MDAICSPISTASVCARSRASTSLRRPVHRDIKTAGRRRLITQQAIRRGSFRNVRELVGKIDAYVAHYNAHKRPFVWTATAIRSSINFSASVNLLMGHNTSILRIRLC